MHSFFARPSTSALVDAAEPRGRDPTISTTMFSALPERVWLAVINAQRIAMRRKTGPGDVAAPHARL